jgi:glycosyltransferase involved in cell wall biosynthesis
LKTSSPVAPPNSVSYLIPVYNPGPDLIATLQSIEQGEYLREIVVVDDQCSQGTQYLIQAQHLPRVRVISNTNDKGISGALNTGLTHIKDGFVARLDAGDIDLPNRIPKQLYTLINSSCDLVASSMLIKSPSHQGEHLQRSRYSKIFNVISPWSIVPHPTWLFRKEAVQFPYRTENLRSEDYCFLAENKFEIALLVEPTIIYDGAGNLKPTHELIATAKKVKSFISCSTNQMGAALIGSCYGLLRAFRVLVWRRKFLKR